jgi:Uma2 family endonuclease
MDVTNAPEAADVLAPLRRRTDVQQYEWMARAGMFGADERTELLDGEVIAVAAMNVRHAWTVNQLMRRFLAAVGDRAHVAVQTPLKLSELSLPEPDLLVARARADGYRMQHPAAADAWLVVEVADTSARVDRIVKLPLYARAGVAAVWIVDLERRCVSLHSQPTDAGYGMAREEKSPGIEAVPGLDGIAIDLSGLLA